jgi:hypothetical protein
MNDTERYLKAATKGLWGRERSALKAELRGHISARVQEFRLGGLSEAEAERQTLRELGAPVQVSSGMLSVHTLPTVGKAGALTALLATALLTVVPQGLAQVSSQFLLSDIAQGPTDATSYLDFGQLRTELKKVGGAINGSTQDPSISLPGVPHSPVSLDLKNWPGSFFMRAGHQYLGTGAFLRSVSSTGAKLRLSGWNPVQVHVNQTVLNIQTGGDRRVGNALYRDYLSMIAGGDLPPILTSQMDKTDLTGLTFKGAFHAGDVYTLVIPLFKSWWKMEGGVQMPGGEIVLSLDTNVAQDGALTLNKYIAADPYRFAPSLDAFKTALKPYLSPTSQFSYWDAQHPAPALLLKLTSRSGGDAYTVVNPATVKGTLSDH